MKVELPNMRVVMFDCPWQGHVYDPGFVLRNSAAPSIIGHRCMKCGCLIYERVTPSSIIGPDGAPLAEAPAAEESR